VRPTPASVEEIAAFERLHSVSLPADFRDYLLRFNGTQGDGDSRMLTFWQLDKLVPMLPERAALPEADRYFVFADYMISSWEYAIYFGDTPTLKNQVVLYEYPAQPVVAQTFSGFLELYLQNPDIVYAS
jgi:hypothetical protein